MASARMSYVGSAPRGPLSRLGSAALAAALACSVVAVVTVATAPAAQAAGSGVTHATVVSAVPSTATPNITNGTDYAITQVGSQIVTGGSFTGVQDRSSTTTLTRTDVLAFDAGTGKLSTSFAPTLDGIVRTVYPGPSANTVYVGGQFTTVNGTRSKSITLLDTNTGAIVPGFVPAALNGIVYDIARVGSHLLLAGSFTTAAGVAHAGLVSLNATSGKLDPWVAVQLAGHHNYNGTSGSNGAVGPRSLAVNPAGTQAVVIGNFTTANGQPRDQIVELDLGATGVTVDPWTTLKYTAACFSWAFDTYMTDVQYSADGSWFVVTATGGSGTNTDGSNSLCDSAARWEATGAAVPAVPTWISYTGQDTLWSVAVTGAAVYVGGHQRWLNNSQGHDNAGAGAVPRPGLAALDPASGTPLSWNPGRNPRGAGAYAVFASPTGLYVGSDTDWIGNNAYKRQKIAYFPLAGGTAPASTATAALPANVYTAGQLPISSSSVLYRVNAGGPTVAATDGGPNWQADSNDSDPGAQYRNTGSAGAQWGCCAARSAALPAGAPTELFNSERWDSGTAGDGGELHWSFPVPAGLHVAVRLYFANRFSGTGQVGQRVFDVAVDGTTVLDHYDIVAEVGDQTATMHEFDETSPGAITIDLAHEVEQPLINAIEVVNLDAPASDPAAQDDLAYHAVNGSRIGPRTVLANTGIAWSTSRGVFMAGNAIFYGTADGTFHRASFTGTTVGTSTTVDPYNDPAWSAVLTGSGQTYRGAVPAYYGELPQVTGAFYSAGRLYYSLAGQSALYSRGFNPDSGIVGSDEFTTAGANFADVAGMVLSGSTLYYATRSDGSLHTISFANATPDATTDATISGPALDGIDWRARGLFLYGPATFPNQPPTAAVASSCTDLTCSFDGTGSADPDGSVASYAWDFGDGTTGTTAAPKHGYAQPGTYTVGLVVTDDRGAASTTATAQLTVTAPPAQVAFVAAARSNAVSATPSVVVPAGVAAGDTELLFLTTGTVGVTTSVPAGWTQLARRTNTAVETTVFRRTATAADAGTRVTVPLAASAASELSIADYSGVDGAAPVITSAGDTNVAAHLTPAVPVVTGGSWVLSYWADKTSATSTWTLPGGVSPRLTGVGTGGGHVDAALADLGPVGSGTFGGASATTGAVSGRADMMSVVLVPGVAG